MANILDLSVVEPESWIIRLKNGDEFEIPGTISLGIVLKMQSNYRKLLESKGTDEEEYNFMKKTVMEILRYDTENAKKATDKYIMENKLDSVAFMDAIITGFMAHVQNIEQDPNLSSPQSPKK